jgi:hypothetical protein
MSVVSISPASRKRSAFRLKVPFWFGKMRRLLTTVWKAGSSSFNVA